MSSAEQFIDLQEELKGYIPALSKAIEQIIASEVTEYPIFVAHQQIVDVGIPIIEKENVKGNWSINVSSLEEFVTKTIIHSEKIDEFKRVYKSPEDFVTFFILSELGAQFISIPREA